MSLTSVGRLETDLVDKDIESTSAHGRSNAKKQMWPFVWCARVMERSIHLHKPLLTVHIAWGGGGKRKGQSPRAPAGGLSNLWTSAETGAENPIQRP